MAIMATVKKTAQTDIIGTIVVEISFGDFTAWSTGCNEFVLSNSLLSSFLVTFIGSSVLITFSVFSIVLFSNGLKTVTGFNIVVDDDDDVFLLSG